MQHLFDVNVAAEFGVNQAIFLKNIAYWILHNKANNLHYHEGKYWTYNTQEAFSEIFPYWSVKQIKTIIKKCIFHDLLVKNRFNKYGYDQTLWYSLTDKGMEALGILISPNGPMEKTKWSDGTDQKGQPIPDNKPDDKQHITSSSCASDDDAKECEDKFFNSFWETYPKKTGKKAAYKSWIKNKLDNHADIIISDINNRKKQNWLGKRKQYIPDPATYLNNERWTDELFISQEITNGRRQTKGEQCVEIHKNAYVRALQEDQRNRNETSPQSLDHNPFSAVSSDMA